MGFLNKANASARDANVSAATSDSRSPSREPATGRKVDEAIGSTLAPEQSIIYGELERVRYVTMEWWQVGALMVAEVISLGILSLPSALATLGFGPGLALIVGFGLVATYTGFLIGEFKKRHRHVKDMADAGEILFGSIGFPQAGRLVFGIAQVLFLLFISAAHVLSFSIMMNVLTSHGTCSIFFGFIGGIVSLFLTLPRTLGKISYLAVGSCISITSAVIICMAALGTEYSSGGITSALPKPGVTFAPALVAVMDMVLAYAGNVAFFGFMDEMKKPEDFHKSLALLQTCAITFYVVVASVIYYYAGESVRSPALSSASPLFMKISYGVAIPTIVIAGVINGHVAIKQLYKTFFSAETVNGKGTRSYGIWLAIVASFWIVAWVIAEAIPDFNALLALISALFGSWFTYGIGGWLYLYDYRRGVIKKDWKSRMQIVFSIGLLFLAAALMGLGTYSAIRVIVTTTGGQTFSCGDNSPTAAHA